MTALNGHPALEAPPALNPAGEVARAVYDALWEDGDETFEQLSESDRTDLVYLAEHYIAAHLAFLGAHGWKVIPPGSVPVPKSEPEAMAMVRAAKAFLDAHKRKGSLLATPKKLILPGRVN